MKVFKIDKSHSAVCQWAKTRVAFKHTATMLVNGNDYGLSVKINYLNRTWERYEFESVLSKLLHKSGKYTDKQITKMLDKFNPYGKSN